MCGQLGRAWGNDLFGPVEPREEVCLAAEQHDTGWLEWEAAPTLDRATGLPHTFRTVHYTHHLAIHAAWSRALVAQSRYAALLVSMHHRSFFPPPGRFGRLRDGGRRIAEFRGDLERLEQELRASLGASDDEVERNHRLVRTWDGLSHDLLLGLAPRVRTTVPTDSGTTDLSIGSSGGVHTVDPWPFQGDCVVVRTEGRLLRGTFEDEQAMRDALGRARWMELTYELRPA